MHSSKNDVLQETLFSGTKRINMSTYKDAEGVEITEQEMEDKVRATLGEMSSWELIDIIEQYIPLWELVDLAFDDEGNWYG